MTQKTLWRGALVVLLCVALAMPLDAQQNIGPSFGGLEAAAIAAVVLVAGVIIIVIVVVTHGKKTITGCVNPGDNGMSVTDEKDKQIYKLSGNTADIKSGHRVTLKGKKMKSKDKAKPLTWQVDKLTKDFGLCHP